MSRSADSQESDTDAGWGKARNQLFSMIMEGRSFSGHEQNCCFLNTGETQFATVSAISGLDFPDDARCIAVTDWDQDGDQDLWISNRNAPRLRFMRNDNSANNHFLSLQLVGNGTTTNRDAIGARVAVNTGDKDSLKSTKTLRAGEGFLSQSTKWLHFGLGANDIRSVTVHWPGAEPQTFNDLKTDCRYRLTQGSSSAQALPKRSGTLAITDSQPALPGNTRAARIKMQSSVLMPSFTYELPDGKKATELFEYDGPTIVHLWASWCAPCVEELEEFASRSEELQKANVNVVSLSVDAIGEKATSPESVKGCMKKLSYPFAWGYIGTRQMQRLQELNDQFFFSRRPLPLPSSFLVDDEGRLSIIYRGTVSVQQLLDDLHGKSDRNSIEQAACITGRSIIHPRIEEVDKRTELQTRHRVATWLEASGQSRDAIRHFTELAEAEPTWALPIRHLAKLYLGQNQLEEATRFAERAMQLNPQSARVQNTMGLLQSRKGNQTSASEYFRKAIELDAQFAGAFNNLGIVLAMENNLPEARKNFLLAIEKNEEFAKAHTNLGNVYAATTDSQRALFHYQKAIEIDPLDVEPYNNLGTMFGRQGNIQQAIRYYQEAYRIDPSNKNTRKNLQRASDMLNSRK